MNRMQEIRLAFVTFMFALIVVAAGEIAFHHDVEAISREEEIRSAAMLPFPPPLEDLPPPIPEYEFHTYLDQRTGTWHTEFMGITR